MDQQPMTPKEPFGTPYGESKASVPQSTSGTGEASNTSGQQQSFGGSSDNSLNEMGLGTGQHGHRGQEARAKLNEAKERAKMRAREQASIANQRAREYGYDVFCNNRSRAADEVSHFSGAIREASKKLREDKDENIAHYLDVAAGQVDRLQHYVSECEPSQLLDDANAIARRHPGVVIGGMFAAGLAIGRFLKASSERYDSDNFDFEDDDYSTETHFGTVGSGAFGESAAGTSYSSGQGIPPTQSSTDFNIGSQPPYGQPT